MKILIVTVPDGTMGGSVTIAGEISETDHSGVRIQTNTFAFVEKNAEYQTARIDFKEQDGGAE